MSFDALNRWLTPISNLGVLAGFILLAVQMNQNTQALRLQYASDFARDAAAAEMAAIGDTPNVSYAAAIDHPSELTTAQLADVWAYVDAGIYAALHVWSAHEAGYASDADWVAARRLGSSYVNFNVGQVIWKHWKSEFPADFVAEIDRELATSNPKAIQQMWGSIMSDIRKLEGQQDAGTQSTKPSAPTT